jgi:glycosyltransferase involved in cell wall biosynthesis
LNPSVKFLIGGDGPAKTAMQKELPEAVYAGYVVGEELAKLYASSDIFLFPSDTETFGNVTLEALSCGLPAVVANGVGGSSIVLHEETGYITTPRNPDAFAECLFKLSTNHDLRKIMSINSRKRAMTFEWESIMNGLLKDYKKVIRNYNES